MEENDKQNLNQLIQECKQIKKGPSVESDRYQVYEALTRLRITVTQGALKAAQKTHPEIGQMEQTYRHFSFRSLVQLVNECRDIRSEPHVVLPLLCRGKYHRVYDALRQEVLTLPVFWNNNGEGLAVIKNLLLYSRINTAMHYLEEKFLHQLK